MDGLRGSSTELGKDILVGAELKSRLAGTDEWSLRSVGRHELRGKEQPVELFDMVMHS